MHSDLVIRDTPERDGRPGIPERELANWGEKVYKNGDNDRIATILPEGIAVSIGDFIEKAHGALAERLHPLSDLIHTPDGGIPEKWITVVQGPIGIHASSHPTQRDLPPDVLERRAVLITEEGEKAARGERAIHEDFRKEILSLAVHPPEQEGQAPQLILQTGDTNYFTIRTLENMRLEAGRDDPGTIAKYFQNHWGMSTLVRARDDNGDPVFIFSKRSDEVDFYPGCYNVTASGSMEKRDFFENGEMNLQQVAIREVKEETGIRVDPSRDTIEVLGLGYNPERSDWNLQMYVRTEQQASEILANRDQAPDAWETDGFAIVRADQPETILGYLREHQGEWTPTGTSAIYNALCRDFGEEAVRRAWES
ncbi:MAG: NUDIX domain-containing protein [Ktedonobacteraceae bacterium]|nr:NUDIX domain-containing protein [Ktedonobacteraceae bacterium]